jgi:hypothetical protein
VRRSIAFSILLCSCSPPPTITATIGGQSFTTHESISWPAGASLHLLFASTSNACSDLAADVVHPNEFSMELFVASDNPQVLPTAGTYVPAKQGGASNGQSWIYDATCAPIMTTLDLVAGTMTLTSVRDDYSASGTIDVSFGNGLRASGSFSTRACPTLGPRPVAPACR